jgi:hypothetical protein
MKLHLHFLLCVLISAFLAGCGDGSESYAIPVQHWKDADIRVEIHPNPPLAGMSEVVVIITGVRGRPIPDFSVSIRGNYSAKWVQTIQDGMIGVYRRAVDIGEGDVTLLQVRLKLGDDQKVLLYPLKLARS